MLNTYGPDVALSIVCVLISLGSLIMNGSLFLLIASSPELRRRDFTRFILVRSLGDAVFSTLYATIHPMAILMSTPDSPMCTVAGFAQTMFAIASMNVEPLLATNRYVSIFHSDRYDRVYSRRNVYAMCTMAWVIAIAAALPHVFIGSYGRSPGSICTVELSKGLLTSLLFNYVVLLSGLGVVMVCNLRMFVNLRRYQSQPMSNSQRSKLQNDREMLRFIFVVALLPMLFEGPVIVLFVVEIFTVVPGWIMFAAMTLFSMSYIVNPLVTLLMVRPIRDRLSRAIRRRAASVQPSEQPPQPSHGPGPVARVVSSHGHGPVMVGACPSGSHS